MKLTDAQTLTIAFSVVILLDLGFIAWLLPRQYAPY